LYGAGLAPERRRLREQFERNQRSKHLVWRWGYFLFVENKESKNYKK
jgi:hypothetical protein